jgi:hypothetical protein
VPRRIFGPTWFEVRDARRGLTLRRTVLCPEGEVPWVLVHVRLALSARAAGSRRVRHVEQWALRPRFLNLLETADDRRRRAEAGVTYDLEIAAGRVTARERFASPADGGAAGAARSWAAE